jgi:hypothetical protein
MSNHNPILVFFHIFMTACLTAQTPSEVKNQTALEWLLSAKAFNAVPAEITDSAAPLRETPDSNLFPSMILSGISPKNYAFFIFREPLDTRVIKFEIIFFNEDGSGQSIAIPESSIVESSVERLVFRMLLKGGGEAGQISVARTFSFYKFNQIEIQRPLKVLIEEDTTTTSLWSGRHRKTSHVELKFEFARLKDGEIHAARGINGVRS